MGVKSVRLIGAEVRLARRSAGLSLAAVARETRLSVSEVSRIERAQVPGVSLLTLCRLAAVVGLDLSARVYPGGPPLRDARHAGKLERLRLSLHASLGWAVEVPLPNPGDQRAWDAMIRGVAWRYGVECEMNPMDGQAIMRRLKLKQRDGMVDGVILLMPDTRQSRQFRRELSEVLRADFPTPGRVALARFRDGADPGGSAVIAL